MRPADTFIAFRTQSAAREYFEFDMPVLGSYQVTHLTANNIIFSYSTSEFEKG